MKIQSLQVLKHHPYLGVELSDNMKYNLYLTPVKAQLLQYEAYSMTLLEIKCYSDRIKA